jgi:O-antigen/teichoic acid export membrane protein
LKAEVSRLVSAAFLWKAIQLGGVKGLFLIRFLVLARILSPDDFGLMAIGLTAVGFFLLISDCGIVPALVQRTDVSERHYNTAWTLEFLRGLVVTSFVVLVAPTIASIFNESRATDIIRFLALTILLDAAASIKMADLIRNLNFRSIACVKLAQVLVDTTVAIALAPFLGVWALVVGAVSGSAAHAVVSYIVAPHFPQFCLRRSAVLSIVRYGRWILLAGLLAVAGEIAVRMIITRKLGTAELGIYFMALKIAFLPAEIAKEVVGPVAFPIYARFKSDIAQATEAFRSIFTGMSALLIVFSMLILALAASLVENVLGTQWEAMVWVVRVIALVGVVGLIGDASVSVVKGLGQSYRVTLLEATHSVVLVACTWGLVSRYGLIGVALACLLANGAFQVLGAAFVYQLLQYPFRRLSASISSSVVASAIGASLALAVDNVLFGILGFVVAALTGVTVTGAILWCLDRRFNLCFGSSIGWLFPALPAAVPNTTVKDDPSSTVLSVKTTP